MTKRLGLSHERWWPLQESLQEKARAYSGAVATALSILECHLGINVGATQNISYNI